MLARLARYLDRTWDFTELVSELRDTRQYPQIPTSSVFLSVFGMMAQRLGSLNGLEQQLRMPGRWDAWTGPKKPSADTVGYCLERIVLDGLRSFGMAIAQGFKRKKAFRRLYPDIHWVGALDGIETYKSRSRCCDKCLKRNLGTHENPDIEYYHRYVYLQLVGVTPAVILEIEPLEPGDTEATSALRLMERFHKRGPRFLDVLTADAFYLQAPFGIKVLEMKYYLVVVLKQENRDLYQDVEGLLKVTAPTEGPKITDGRTVLWDFNGLTSWESLGRPVRVVREFKTKKVTEIIGGQKKEREIPEDWRWAVLVPEGKAQPPAELIARWGHARWDEETRGFGELTQHWHLDHNYHHHPVAMLAFLWILSLAFSLTTVFFQRNLKPAMRKGKTRLHLARLLADDLMRCLKSFWLNPPWLTQPP
jgi:hypothetical protein